MEQTGIMSAAGKDLRKMRLGAGLVMPVMR